MGMRRRTIAIASVATILPALAFGWYYAFLRDTGDSQLAGYVKSKPAFSVVFTSRSEPASFRAASEIGDYSPTAIGAKSSGQPQWQARDGRLRILTPQGHVRELTYGKQHPDGATLTDVMSPSVSPDGNTIVFAGRRTGKFGGRFRIYSVDLDGENLKPLTGGSDDPGCVRLPPLRYGGRVKSWPKTNGARWITTTSTPRCSQKGHSSSHPVANRIPTAKIAAPPKSG